MKCVFLLALVVAFAAYTFAGSLFNGASTTFEGPQPEHSQVHTNAFWFGTQDLTCVLGIQFDDLARDIRGRVPGWISSIREKRAARRTTLNPNHRIVYYKGQVFEWGTGSNGYHVGHQAVTRDCPVKWEREPAGYSHCPLRAARNFIHGYRTRYGGYNLLTNNCHHFANRLSHLLSSSSCTVPSSRWAHLARNIWRKLGEGNFNVRDMFKSPKEANIPTID